MTRRSRSSSRRRSYRKRSRSPYHRGSSRHRHGYRRSWSTSPQRRERHRSERSHFSRYGPKSHDLDFKRHSRFSDTHFEPDYKHRKSYTGRRHDDDYTSFKTPSLDFKRGETPREEDFVTARESYRTPREEKTPRREHDEMKKETGDHYGHQNEHYESLQLKNKTESPASGPDTGRLVDSTTQSIDNTPKETLEQETTWKGFPVPKLFGDNEKFYETYPKLKFRDVLAPLYMPRNGPKMKRYKNFQVFSDILEKCNKARITWRDDIEKTILSGFNLLEEKIKLSRINSELNPIVGALNVLKKRPAGGTP